jgi:hypothetical protein
MSRLTDLYKRVMYGQAGMDMPGQGMSGGTSGLFGQGGQQSGGLIDFNKMNNQEGGLLQNIPQSALLGSAIFGQGMKGIDPFSALLPAVTQTAQLQQYMTPTKGRLISAYNPETKEVVYEYERDIKAKGLTPVPKEFEGTAAERNYASYLKVVEGGDPMKIKIASQVYGRKGKDPMSKEEFLAGVAKNLTNEYTDSEEIIKKLPGFAKVYDEVYKDMETPTSVSTETLSVPESKDQLIDGQLYNVNGQSMKWNKKKDNFE